MKAWLPQRGTTMLAGALLTGLLLIVTGCRHSARYHGDDYKDSGGGCSGGCCRGSMPDETGSSLNWSGVVASPK
jgi:hypothetical protein